MMTDTLRQPKRLLSEILRQATQAGLARAIDARKAAGLELSAGDLDPVAGGLPLIIKCGPLPVDGLANNPVLNPVSRATLTSVGNPAMA
jgi:hypothetical protein